MVGNHEIPVHSLDEIRYLLSEDAWYLATRKCRDNVVSLGLLGTDVKDMLLALTQADFRSEFGKCDSDFGEVEADDYLLWFDEDRKIRCRPYAGQGFYIKLAIHTTAEGACCLIISLHAEGRP